MPIVLKKKAVLNNIMKVEGVTTLVAAASEDYTLKYPHITLL